MEIPDVQYARSGDVAIAYQVVGEGPIDLVFVRGTLADLLAGWDMPLSVDHVEGLGRSGRVLLFDKRGSGLSDPVRQVPTLETRMDDIRAVMDAVGSERAVLWAAQEGARIAGLAAPGEILVSSTVKDLVAGSGIAFEDRGAHELKGVPEEWRLFAVVGA